MKYNNEKVSVNGEVFDSKLEFYRYQQLKILERARAIKDLKRQEKFTLIDKSEYGREIAYIADFTYTEDGKKVVEDTKSKATKTPLYRLKKRLLAERYGIKIKEVTREQI